MYGSSFSFGLIRACRSGSENGGSSAKSETSLLTNDNGVNNNSHNNNHNNYNKNGNNNIITVFLILTPLPVLNNNTAAPLPQVLLAPTLQDK